MEVGDLVRYLGRSVGYQGQAGVVQEINYDLNWPVVVLFESGMTGFCDEDELTVLL